MGRESQKDQRGRPRGVGRGEEKFHRPALGKAHESRPLRAGGVHHRADVVHPLLESRELVYGYRIPESGASLVPENETSEGGEPAKEAGGRRLLPDELEVGDPAMEKDQIERALAKHLVGDVGPATLGVLGLWW